MSGGYFDVTDWAITNLAEELYSFVNKQLLYRANKVNENLPTGDYDHELSLKTLTRLQHIADDLVTVANKFREADYLLSSDISEESFNKTWDEFYEN